MSVCWWTSNWERKRDFFCVFWIMWFWWTPTFFKIPSSKNGLRTYMHVFRHIPPIVFGKTYRLVKTRHFLKLNCTVELSTLIKSSTLQFPSTDFADSSQIFLPKSSFISFFNVEELLFFDQKRSKTSRFKKDTFSRRLTDFGNIILLYNLLQVRLSKLFFGNLLVI